MDKMFEKFMEMYPAKECTENPLITIEAIGFLKALIEVYPELEFRCLIWIMLYTNILNKFDRELSVLEEVSNGK